MQRISTPRADIGPALLFAAVPLAFIALITIYQIFVIIPAAKSLHEKVQNSFFVIRNTGDLGTEIQNAERGLQGFLLTGSDFYLEPYERAKERIPRLLGDLQQATLDRPGQQVKLLKLQADLTAKMNELTDTIAIHREKGFNAALAIVNSDLGRKAMEAIQADTTEILDAAHVQLQIGLDESEVVNQRAALGFLMGSAIAAAALIASGALLTRAYKRAAASKQLMQSTLESVREGVAAFDADNRLLAWNQTFKVMLRLPKETLFYGKSLAEQNIPIGNFNQVFQALNTQVKETGKAALTEIKVEGQSFEVFHNPAEHGGSVTTLLDRTEQRQAEEALRQAQKLEALGQMTGGIAHDFNNLLTVIIGGTRLLQRTVGKDAQALQRIDMVTMAAERGARLIQQLLAFARQQPLEPTIVNLGHLVTDIIPMLQRAVGDKIRVEYVTSGALWNTTIDAIQFQTAVLNLAINARDAMPEGGMLTIEVANATLDEAYAAGHPEVNPGQYVMFAITDTGKGMDAATAMRAIEPFFTTKPVGEGTGLGLPQVYGFVKQSGGHLKIYSEVGGGTTIKLYLPRELGEVISQNRQVMALSLTGTETILLVDDDESVRTTVASMLESLGYEVIAVAGGAEAVSILENGPPVALLFTDIVMPGAVNGRKLAERAAEMNPAIKVLFTSGYTENAIVHNSRLDPGVEFLSKPYDRERLALKVRRVLDGGAKETAGPETENEVAAIIPISSADN